MTKIATSLLATLVLVGAAHADELRPHQGRSIELGGTTGVAYYTVVEDGFQIVATLAAGEATAPVRFIATLAPGQSVVLSVPQALNETAKELEIRRNGDVIAISDVSAEEPQPATR